MAVNTEKYKALIKELSEKKVQLVAVSKLQSADGIKAMHDLGQRDFGENYVQELLEKQAALPQDIRWHFIGHLQRNKVKYLAPFVHLIHGVDSLQLLKEINKQGSKQNRVIRCLLQMHIAQEETKFGMNEAELGDTLNAMKAQPEAFTNVLVEGLMGMASFTDNTEKVKAEMQQLKALFDKYSPLSIANCQLSILSMGMSGDYELAIKEGSNMVRIGSLLFGARRG